jgi:hypothetical protein
MTSRRFGLRQVLAGAAIAELLEVVAGFTNNLYLPGVVACVLAAVILSAMIRSRSILEIGFAFCWIYGLLLIINILAFLYDNAISPEAESKAMVASVLSVGAPVVVLAGLGLEQLFRRRPHGAT